MPKVSVARCSSYRLGEVVRSVEESVSLLGGIGRFVSPGERILVKPNLLAGRPPEAAVTTHPAVVEAVLRLIIDTGAHPAVGDSPGMGTARNAAGRCGILEVCDRLGVELIELKELSIVENPGGVVFKRLEVAKEALSFDGIVNLPKLKTHTQMYLTLAVKNLFGCVPGKLKPQWHLSAGVETRHFAGMLLDLCAFLSPRLTVMDGVVGMEGNGPGSGEPRDLGLVLASSDCVAMDAIIARLLGARTDEVPILEAARRRGLAQATLDGVEIAGADLAGARVKGFRFPPMTSLNFADRLPYFLERPLRKALTSRPHIDGQACTLCGVCVGVCPAGVMAKGGRIEIDYDRCIRCYCCQEMCPEGAISARDGWLKRIIPGL